MTEKLLAWFGDPEVKERALARLKEHRAKDEIVQGGYQDFLVNERWVSFVPVVEDQALGVKAFKGCAIGCTLPPVPVERRREYEFTWHAEMQRVYGIDESVAALIDDTFESQESFDDAARFAVEVVEAIPVGADLTAVAHTYWCSCNEDCPGSEIYTDTADRLIEALRNAPVPE